MTYTKDTALVDDGTSTQLLGRTVHSQIKDLIPNDCVITKLIKEMSVDSKTGAVTQKNGVIPVKSSKHSRVEVYTHSPEADTQTAGAVSSLDIVLANAATQIHEKMVFLNTANKTIGYVDAISGTTVSFISVGSTFSATEGDTLLSLGANYEYGSADPKYIVNTDDNHYNIMCICRTPIETTNSAKDSEQNAGGNLFDRYKQYKVTKHVREFERNIIYGKRAASGNTTDMTALGTTVPTTRGLRDMAQVDFDFENAMTMEKIYKGIYLAMDRSMDVNKTYLWLLSKQAYAEITNLMSDNAMLVRKDEGNVMKKYGIKADTLITAGPNLAMVVHDAFNWGSNVSDGLILDPEDLEYRYKNGPPPKGVYGNIGNDRNFAIVKGIQSNSSDTRKDEILNESCVLSLSGGHQIMTTSSMI